MAIACHGMSGCKNYKEMEQEIRHLERVVEAFEAVAKAAKQGLSHNWKPFNDAYDNALKIKQGIMTIEKIPESHVDHSLSALQLLFVLSQEAPAGEVIVQTVEFPVELGTVPCGLYGPAMGDRPVLEHEVEYRVRGERDGVSRLLKCGVTRPTRMVTVISGPGPDESKPCVLYTAFGGPAAPRELFEDDGDESREFWAEHALVE